MKIATLLIAAAVIGTATPAHAGPCSKEIAMVTDLLGGGGSDSMPSVGSDAVPSTSALSTTTGGGTAGALGSGAAANPEALAAVKQAQSADAAGDEASCMDYIGKAKQLLGLVQ